MTFFGIPSGDGPDYGPAMDRRWTDNGPLSMDQVK